MNDITLARLTYPRVSEIIAKQNQHEIRGIPLENLLNASIRGTKIHAYCTAYVLGLYPPEIEPEYEPYVNCFMDWAQKNIDKPLHASIRLYDDSLRFTGEFDMLVSLKDTKKIALLDLKSSAKESKSWAVQLSAYKHLCELNGYKVDQVFNLHLKRTKPARYEQKEGEKVLVSPPSVKIVTREHKDLNSAWEIFSSALKCYDYFYRREVS